MTDNLFDDSAYQDQTTETEVDYVEQLVGEGKKFRDVQSLAKGKAEADRTIEILKARLDEANRELTTRTSLDQFLDEVKQTREAPQHQQQEPTPPVQQPNVEELVESLLSKKEQERRAKENLQSVQKVLREQFGSNTAEVLRAKAAEYGYTEEKFSQLATESPVAFLRLVGADQQRQPTGTVMPRSSVATSGQQVPSGVKNSAYFEKMKQTDPVRYRQPSTGVEMIKAMKECQEKGIPW